MTANRPAFDPAKGDAVVFSFRLQADALVTLALFDLAHRRVCTPLDGAALRAGLQTVAWNGATDGGGRAGAGQASYPVLSAAASDAPVATWDPVSFSGGQPLAVPPTDWRFDAARGRVVYSLERSARVRIRAGVHGGPLLKTLIEWAPRTAGNHEEPWDGKDDAGIYDVSAAKGFTLVLDAYSLPDGAVLLQGTPGGSTGIVAAKTAKADAERASLLRKTLLAPARPLDPHFLSAHALDSTPGFRIELVGAATGSSTLPIASNPAQVRVTLDDATASQLLSDRFEIIAYVDMQRVFEEEQA
ncbi:MAG: hypothetical protein HY303_16735 [Candidatus Wallbacteria bacterium]|nr:hypothetical protein [Candidatus Wallbacteria bacterium]